jgi:hypothetical protein
MLAEGFVRFATFDICGDISIPYTLAPWRMNSFICEPVPEPTSRIVLLFDSLVIFTISSVSVFALYGV